MTEQLGRVETSPYRPIFAAIEAVPDCTPAAAYQLYAQELEAEQLDPSVYLSMAITSGGYARDKDLPFAEAMDRNGNYVSMVAAALSKQYAPYITAEDIVVPSDLGKVAGWSQADYLLFWAHVITGIDPAEATQLDAAVRTTGVMELPGFHNKTLSREDKWADYTQLVETYTQQFIELGIGQGRNGARWPRNMQAVILALDAPESLGVNAERYLCHRLGLGEHTVELAADHTELLSASQQVTALGADVLPTGQGNISGQQDRKQFFNLREQGVRFRTSGLIGGVIFRKIAAAQPSLIEEPRQTSEELWTDYYTAKS